MLVLWPDAADALRDMLRQQGLDPSRVESPASAWRVFREFLAVGIDGPAPSRTCDRLAVSWDCPDWGDRPALSRTSDRFAVSWGRPDWCDGLPTLSFIRRLATDKAELTLSLDMVFQDRPDFADVAELNAQSSGYYAVRPADEAVSEALWEVERYPALRCMWASPPLWSTVSFGVVDSPGRDPALFDAQQMAAYLDYRARNG